MSYVTFYSDKCKNNVINDKEVPDVQTLFHSWDISLSYCMGGAAEHGTVLCIQQCSQIVLYNKYLPFAT